MSLPLSAAHAAFLLRAAVPVIVWAVVGPARWSLVLNALLAGVVLTAAILYVAARRGPAQSAWIQIDVRLNLLTGDQLSVFHLDLVDDHAAYGRIGIGDTSHSFPFCECRECPGIAYLSTGFGVKWRLIQNDFGRCITLD